MSQDRTQNKNVTGNVAGQIHCNLSMLTLEVSVITALGFNHPSKPTLVLNLLIKSLIPKTDQNQFSRYNTNIDRKS